ncbi:MAG: alpha/beta hydrolase [Chloroflexi bacterium]|nr:alpha/beta hydrolase [Chloroflexota bacterium]
MTTESLRKQLGGMPLFEAARVAGIKFSKEVLPEDKHVKVGKIKMHYLDWGNHGKPKYLLLHGGAQTAHMWDFFALAMRDNYHIVAVDQRGHGDTDWVDDGDYSAEAHVEDIDGFTDKIGFDKFNLQGLSMGGRNSYGFAAKHPKKVKALVIVDVGPDIQVEGRKRIQEFLEDTEVFESFDWLVERVKRYNPFRDERQIRGSLVNNLKQLSDGRWTWKHDRRRGIRRDRGGEFMGFRRLDTWCRGTTLSHSKRPCGSF